MRFLSTSVFILLLLVAAMNSQLSLSFLASSMQGDGSGNPRRETYGKSGLLIPSQVSRKVDRFDSSSSRLASTDPSVVSNMDLVPSQVLSSSDQVTHQVEKTLKSSKVNMDYPNVTSLVSSFNTDDLSSVAASTSTRKRRKPVVRRKHMKRIPVNVTDRENRKTGDKTLNRSRRVLMGDLPDIHWRAVPMEHLRHHPHFVALPPPETIASLDTLEDVRMFRQDSWQWDALHEGRCTTSQVAAGLGLLEPKAGRVHDIPASWRRGGRSTFHRLQQRPLRTLQEMNDVLCEGATSIRVSSWTANADKGPFWVVPTAPKVGSEYPFAAKYLMKITPEERRRRRHTAKQYAANGLFMSVRMTWGSVQEATSILTALNYFWKQNSGVVLKEAGMCGAGLIVNQTDAESSVLVGASPDAIIYHPDGTVEALEVKNHCPFVPATYYDKKGDTGQRYAVRQMPFRNPSVPPLYVPQLMMEMYCIGPECRSAVMVRQTATNGAVILRLRRDDQWIEEMMFWLRLFQSKFVSKDLPPPRDFFWEDEELGDRYQRFVGRTKEISTKVELLQRVNHNEIQRVLATRRNITSLFLD